MAGTRHCVRHITYNVAQQLFSQCCARVDHVSCRVPVFDLCDQPMCLAHRNAPTTVCVVCPPQCPLYYYIMSAIIDPELIPLVTIPSHHRAAPQPPPLALGSPARRARRLSSPVTANASGAAPALPPLLLLTPVKEVARAVARRVARVVARWCHQRLCGRP